MTRDDENALLILGGLYLLSKYAIDVVPFMEKKGADLYEMTHPDEKDHKNDLPGQRMSKQLIVSLARSVGFPDPNLAAAVAMAESGGYTNAKGDFIDGAMRSIGLWQINTHAHPEYSIEDMANPHLNAKAALHIASTPRGWNHWSAYTHGTYKKFL